MTEYDYWLENPVIIYTLHNNTWYINTNDVPYQKALALQEAGKAKFYIYVGGESIFGQKTYHSVTNLTSIIFAPSNNKADLHLKTMIITDEDSVFYTDFEEVSYQEWKKNKDWPMVAVSVSNGTTIIDMWDPDDNHTQTVPPLEDKPLEASLSDLFTKAKQEINVDKNFYQPSASALTNYENLMTQPQKTIKLDSPQHMDRNHQTLVLVHGSEKSNEKFKERVRRLIGGLNLADTIKADVATVCGGDFYVGLEFSKEPSDGEVDEAQLKQLCSGYMQVIEAKDWNA